MLNYDPRVKTEIRVINSFVPKQDLYGVYLDVETGKLYTKPVICFIVREHLDKSGDIRTVVKAYPVMLSKSGIQEEETDCFNYNNGYLGISSEAEPKQTTWSDDIRDFKKQLKKINV